MATNTDPWKVMRDNVTNAQAMNEELLRDKISHMQEARELRDRIEGLEAELQARPTQFAYDAATKALWHWRNEAARLGKKAAEEPRQMVHD